MIADVVQVVACISLGMQPVSLVAMKLMTTRPLRLQDCSPSCRLCCSLATLPGRVVNYSYLDSYEPTFLVALELAEKLSLSGLLAVV